MITKKGDGSQVKESTDSSSTTLEDDDVKGKYFRLHLHLQIGNYNIKYIINDSIELID